MGGGGKNEMETGRKSVTGTYDPSGRKSRIPAAYPVTMVSWKLIDKYAIIARTYIFCLDVQFFMGKIGIKLIHILPSPTARRSASVCCPERKVGPIKEIVPA